ncbi:MAG TPA: CbiQ family ECF transporter T component, partial [Gemmataceae bacterium]
MTLYVEHLAPTDSPLARWDARWKLAAILLAAFAVAALRAWPPAVAACAGALVLAAVAELPGRWFRTRLFVLALALLPFLFILPLTLEGGQTWKLGPLAVSSRGVETAVLLAGKALAIGTLTLVLLATAPLTDTLAAARKLRLPGVL